LAATESQPTPTPGASSPGSDASVTLEVPDNASMLGIQSKSGGCALAAGPAANDFRRLGGGAVLGAGLLLARGMAAALGQREASLAASVGTKPLDRPDSAGPDSSRAGMAAGDGPPVHSIPKFRDLLRRAKEGQTDMGSSQWSIAEYLRRDASSDYTWSSPLPTTHEKVRAYVQQLESTYFFASPRTPESLAYMIEYYRRRAPRRRRAYRLSGVLVLVIGAVLPFIAAFGERLAVPFGKDMFVAGLAVALSVVAALNQFFRWDEAWKNQTRSLFKLQQLRIMWEAKKAEAYLIADADEALRVLQLAAGELIQSSHDVAGQEMNDFFQLQRFPDARPPHPPSISRGDA
jgi:hypothetical protein